MKVEYFPERKYNRALGDYYKFFTDPNGYDILPYAYQVSSANYERVVINNPPYYLFNEEVETIKKNKKELSVLLSGIQDIVEIGPGSKMVMEGKTLPFLSCAKNLERYHMVDISPECLKSCKDILRSKRKDINIETVIFDLLGEKEVKIKTPNFFAKKAILFFGSTLCNFDYKDQLLILSHISKLMGTNDLLFLGIDSNHDEKSLLAAYTNNYAKDFLTDILNYFCEINPDFCHCIDKIEQRAKWDRDKNLVDIFFYVKEDVNFYIQKHGEIFLKKGTELHGIIAQKPSKAYIENLLKNSGLVTVKMLGSDEGMGIYICKKIVC